MFLRVSDLGVSGLVEADEPRFGGSDEVDDLDAPAEVFVGGEVGVGGGSHHVVHEGDVLGDVLGGPGGEERVQEALITTVKGTLSHCMLYQVLEYGTTTIIYIFKTFV